MTDYAAYVIEPESREKLLAAFPPKYAEVIAHHITHRYPATPAELPPLPEHVEVVGYHDSGSIQVLVVEVDGRQRQATLDADGASKFYHITLSLDRTAGVSARHSNDVLAAVIAEKGVDALCNLPEPFALSAQPQLLQDSDTPKKEPAAPVDAAGLKKFHP
ncbi:MAG: hypothetical protein PW788_03425 [Micavibrio sp.]|nr:hypothetical protein [Micavibrio sp.]